MGDRWRRVSHSAFTVMRQDRPMTAVKSGELAELTRKLAWQINPHLRVSGVLAAGGGGHTELMVAIEGCHAQPCFLALNIDRSGGAAIERELGDELRAAIAVHLGIR
jgi:hypothetical protein